VTAVPSLSVVVPAVNAEAELGDCLASLLAADQPPAQVEIVVVDNGSVDATAAVAGRYGVRSVFEGRRGVGYARNRGVAETGGDVVAFTDPDCVADRRWLVEVVRPFADPGVVAVAGRVVPFPPLTAAERFAARRRSHSQERALDHAERPYALAVNLALRRDALEGLGGFDVRFPGGGFEDADLCWRLRERDGRRIAFAPDALVLHRYRRTRREFLTQHYRYGYGLGLLRTKHGLRRSGRERLRDGALLPAALVDLVRTGAAAAAGSASGADLDDRWLALLRVSGQRAGEAAATLPGGALLRPFRTATSARGSR
jgi:GT2 family glycosyltransferase